jgi:hypothetical protein
MRPCKCAWLDVTQEIERKAQRRRWGDALDAALGDVSNTEAPVAAAHIDGHHHLVQLEHVAAVAGDLKEGVNHTKRGK